MFRLFSSFRYVFLLAALGFGACAARPDKTIENLKSAVAGQQEAAALYAAFSVQARDEGLRNVANLFSAIARSEAIHVERTGRLLSRYGMCDEPKVLTPEVGLTTDNLQAAVRSERYGAETAFPVFVSVAGAERAREAEQLFGWAVEVSKLHGAYCEGVLERLRAEGSDWNVVGSWSVCPQCGCLSKTVNLTETCGLCQAPASSFLLFQ